MESKFLAAFMKRPKMTQSKGITIRRQLVVVFGDQFSPSLEMIVEFKSIIAKHTSHMNISKYRIGLDSDDAKPARSTSYSARSTAM